MKWTNLLILVVLVSGCASRPVIDSQVNQLAALADYHEAQLEAMLAGTMLESATQRANKAEVELDAAKRKLEELLK